MKHVLIVDDYKPFVEDLTGLLRGPEVSVEVAESSDEAQRLLGTKRFDLVITDLFMETQSANDGLDVIRAAKGDWETQVIVVTAHGRPEYCADSMRLGAFDYIEKRSPGLDFRIMLTVKSRLALGFSSAAARRDL